MKSLYMFVNSERPDQYLNSLVYCVLRQDVRKVVFVHIRGLDGGDHAQKNSEGLSHRLMGAVAAQLEGLAERGEYLLKDDSRSDKRVLLKNEYPESEAVNIQAYYANCRRLSISYSNEEIDYVDLRKRLGEIAKEGKEACVDVTSIKKKYIGDLVAAALIEGLVGLYTFDLLESHKPDLGRRPWRTLIHELDAAPTPAFRYTNILDTELYRECVGSIRHVRRMGETRTLKQYAEEHPLGILTSIAVTSFMLAAGGTVWLMTNLNSSFRDSVNSKAGDLLTACGQPGTALAAGPEERLRDAIRACGSRTVAATSAGAPNPPPSPAVPVPSASVATPGKRCPNAPRPDFRPPSEPYSVEVAQATSQGVSFHDVNRIAQEAADKLGDRWKDSLLAAPEEKALRPVAGTERWVYVGRWYGLSRGVSEAMCCYLEERGWSGEDSSVLKHCIPSAQPAMPKAPRTSAPVGTSSPAR